MHSMEYALAFLCSALVMFASSAIIGLKSAAFIVITSKLCDTLFKYIVPHTCSSILLKKNYKRGFLSLPISAKAREALANYTKE